MGKQYFHRVQEQTPTRFWINNVTCAEADLALDAGAVGCTQNPSYVWKLMGNEEERPGIVGLLKELFAQEADDNAVLLTLQRILVDRIAERFMPLYEKSGGRLGYVSIQGDPFREDRESILQYAAESRKNFPNIMAKIPATRHGIEAIETLVAEGVPINATEVMAVRQAVDVCEAYARASAAMPNPPVIYYSHIAGIFDEYMANLVKEAELDVSPDLLWYGGIAVAKKVHRMTKAKWPDVGFISGGARELRHFTEMVGADCAVTINWVGTADKLIENDAPVVERFSAGVPEAVVDALCGSIPDFNKAYNTYAIAPDEYEEFGPVVLFRSYFEASWSKALVFIKETRAK